MIRCEDCKEEFRANSRGSQRIPNVLCQGCVLKRNIFECDSCHTKGCIKEGFYRTQCWECKRDGCTKCIPIPVKSKGIDFDFCKEHSDYSSQELEFDAQMLLDEEKESADLHRMVKK